MKRKRILQAEDAKNQRLPAKNEIQKGFAFVRPIAP